VLAQARSAARKARARGALCGAFLTLARAAS
jgi:hypothetical protein